MTDMNIEQHEQEIDAIEGQVKVLRATQREHHDAMEGKIRANPVAAGPLDQIMHPGSDIAGWIKSMPDHVKQAMKDFFSKDGQ